MLFLSSGLEFTPMAAAPDPALHSLIPLLGIAAVASLATASAAIAESSDLKKIGALCSIAHMAAMPLLASGTDAICTSAAEVG